MWLGWGGGGRGFPCSGEEALSASPPSLLRVPPPTVFLGPHKPPRLPLSGLFNSESDPLEYLGVESILRAGTGGSRVGGGAVGKARALRAGRRGDIPPSTDGNTGSQCWWASSSCTVRLGRPCVARRSRCSSAERGPRLLRSLWVLQEAAESSGTGRPFGFWVPTLSPGCVARPSVRLFLPLESGAHRGGSTVGRK